MLGIRKRVWMAAVLALGLAGCAAFGAGAEAEQAPLPTLDSALLTVTPAPTVTPLPTFTPFPTTERLPTRTPIPTFAPRYAEGAQVAPQEVTPASQPAARPAPTEGPSPTPLPPQGRQDVGELAPDLAPILTIIDTGATCDPAGQHALVQIGVTNRGNAPAENFTVEWSLGWEDPFEGEVRREFVARQEWGLQWTVYFVNKYVFVPCEETTTYRAYVWVDIGDDVAEFYEDNNFAEAVYTIVETP